MMVDRWRRSYLCIRIRNIQSCASCVRSPSQKGQSFFYPKDLLDPLFSKIFFQNQLELINSLNKKSAQEETSANPSPKPTTCRSEKVESWSLFWNRAIGVLGVMDMSQRHPQVVATQIFFIFIPGVSWSNLRVAYFSGLVKNPPTRTSFQLFQASLSLLDYGHLRAGCVACLEPSRNQGAKWEDWHKPTFSQSGTVDGRVPGSIKPYTTNLNWLAVELTGCRIEDLVIWDFDGEGSRWLQGCKRWPLRGNQSICRDPSCSLDFVAILHDDEEDFFFVVMFFF